MAKGKYYTPEFKEQAVKMVAALDCTYDLLHAL
jgi:transposase-like protein